MHLWRSPATSSTPTSMARHADELLAEHVGHQCCRAEVLPSATQAAVRAGMAPADNLEGLAIDPRSGRSHTL